MLDRRTLIGSTAVVGGVAAVGAGVSGVSGGRRASSGGKNFDYELRGTKGRLERLPRLDIESRDDFLAGYRSWGTYTALAAEKVRFTQLMIEAGIDPDAEGASWGMIFRVIENDPVLGAAARYRTDVQDVMYRNLNTEFMENADTYLAELEAYDNRGPGSLELNPDLQIPSYSRYEIHNQPGGFVGHPFSGHLYFYGTNSFFEGRREAGGQDELHTKMAGQTPVPQDGKVLRVLDLGCAVGQLTTSLKERFPDAEVHGVDIAGPMVRFAHMRAVDMDIEVHFKHRRGEDLQYPDNYFDVAASFILHHEIPGKATVEIAKELHRVLRPGGLYFPIDFYTGAKPKKLTPYYMYSMWKDHRWNHEVWREDYRKLDFTKTFKDAGFDVNENGPPARSYKSNFVATKRA